MFACLFVKWLNEVNKINKPALPCIQVVGYKNSGKTTLVSKVIKTCHQKGIKIATLKHHGHGGKPEEPKGFDSSRHLAAGAVVSGVEGDGRLQLSIENVSIEQILAMYEWLTYDFLLIEGYKQLRYPKVVMVKKESDLVLLEQLTHVKLAIVWEKQWKSKIDIPCFSIDEEAAYIHFLLQIAEGG